MDQPIKQDKQPKTLKQEPKAKPISEPVDRFVTQEEVDAPIPSDQTVVFLGPHKKYNHDSNAKSITVCADGSVIYEY